MADAQGDQGPPLDPERVLEQILSTDTGDMQAVARLADALRYHEKGFRKRPEAASQIAQHVELPKDTAAAAFLLSIAADAPRTVMKEWNKMASRLLTQHRPAHVRFVKAEFSAVVRRFADNHMNPKPSVAALGPLQSAMESLSGGEPALLTPAHAAYLRAALATGHVQKAHTVAKVPVFQVQSRQDGMHYTDALLYFYYAGSALCAYQDWRAAVQAFTCALAFPATSLSSIVVAAYKKFVCASLLHSGSVSPLPRHTSSTVSKTVSKHAQAYTTLAKAFQSLNDVAVGTVIAENTAAFQGDSNLGLVMQVLASLKQRRVLKLTNTFLTLSLADIAEKAELESPAAAEAELLSMIQDGKLRATIDQRVGMVTFGGEGQAYATPAEVSRLTQRIATATDVARHFSSLSKTVEVSDEYLERKITSQSAEAGQGGVGGGAGADADVQGMTG